MIHFQNYHFITATSSSPSWDKIHTYPHIYIYIIKSTGLSCQLVWIIHFFSHLQQYATIHIDISFHVLRIKSGQNVSLRLYSFSIHKTVIFFVCSFASRHKLAEVIILIFWSHSTWPRKCKGLTLLIPTVVSVLGLYVLLWYMRPENKNKN